MNYDEWEGTVPQAIREDSLWKIAAYRLALFLSDLGWNDVTQLLRDRRTIGLADQLYRAACSISANVAEGYSRGTGSDRARFSMLWGQLAKAGTGTTKRDTYWARPSRTIA